MILRHILGHTATLLTVIIEFLSTHLLVIRTSKCEEWSLVGSRWIQKGQNPLPFEDAKRLDRYSYFKIANLAV